MRIYHPNWQRNRVNFILKNCIPTADLRFTSIKDNIDFFKGKKILELGSFNGYIGSQFYFWGADVTSVEGRKENVENINKNHPYLKTIEYDLDISDWIFGKYDIIINFGLFYHLQFHHKEHLVNCINNCDIMYFESVIFDSDKNDIMFRKELGIDQSLSDGGGTPTTSFVENIFKENGCKYIKHCSSELNGEDHYYDWLDNNNKDNSLDQYRRRFWVVTK